MRHKRRCFLVHCRKGADADSWDVTTSGTTTYLPPSTEARIGEVNHRLNEAGD